MEGIQEKLKAASRFSISNPKIHDGAWELLKEISNPANSSFIESNESERHSNAQILYQLGLIKPEDFHYCQFRLFEPLRDYIKNSFPTKGESVGASGYYREASAEKSSSVRNDSQITQPKAESNAKIRRRVRKASTEYSAVKLSFGFPP